MNMQTLLYDQPSQADMKSYINGAKHYADLWEQLDAQVRRERWERLNEEHKRAIIIGQITRRDEQLRKVYL